MSGKREYVKNHIVNPCNHYFIGPFQFLILCLVVSESLLGFWMWIVINGDYTERIVIGVLSVAIMIATLVIFCVVYSIKKKSDDFKKPTN